MTGRNLQEEAGLGKGMGGGCKTPKESSDKGPEVPFIPELESLFWNLTKQNQPTKKKKKWLEESRLEKIREQASAAAEMTIQSQDTAEDCTAASGELERSAADSGAVHRPLSNVRPPQLPAHFKNSDGPPAGGREGRRSGTAGRGRGRGGAPGKLRPRPLAACSGFPPRPGQWGGAATASALTPDRPFLSGSAPPAPACSACPSSSFRRSATCF